MDHCNNQWSGKYINAKRVGNFLFTKQVEESLLYLRMVNYIKTDGRSTVEVNVEVSLIKDGEYVVAYCAALELSSYGITEDEAKGAFEGALETFLDDTHEKGTLERVLLDLGWSLKKYPKVKYQPPATKLRSQKLRTEKPLIGSFSERVLIPV